MRSKWKFRYVESSLYYQFHKYNEFYYVDKEEKNKENEINTLEVWSRSSTILPEFLDTIVDIYNGSKFIRIKLETAVLNHKFGEFAYSKKLGPTIHIFGKKKKVKKK